MNSKSVDEKTPLVDKNDEKQPLAQEPYVEPYAPSKPVIGVICSLMVISSVGLINFNKWLMTYGRFPHAMPLVLIHMIVCTLLAMILRVVKPSLFPALSGGGLTGLGLKFYVQGALPIALVFALSMVLSNMVYSHLGMAFIQMIKESNLVWVYIISVICAFERLRFSSITVVCLGIVGMSLTIHGEAHFSLVGFILQLAAILCEATRIILQGLLLQGKKLDPLSYVLTTSPFCGALLVIVLAISAPIGNKPEDMELPLWSEVWKWAPLLLADAVLAFFLNVSIALVLKYTSPMSYVMCQLVKDCLAVAVSIIILGEAVGALQYVGFFIELFAACTWSLMKNNPAEFEEGLVAGFRAILFGIKQTPMAAAPIEKASA
mmetsp:Transcript_3602/g.7880  ORF Transcript_3602/g.7880 Transcript_3602/m.7880 type:complete len:376 (-) Transcript_3602:73-1200(-)